jgi:DNA-binding MarR family transcriptional regulator
MTIKVENVTIKRAEIPMFLKGFLPYRLNYLAERLSGEVMPIYRRKHGMTRPEWRVLVNLAEVKAATASELCEMVPMHKTKVSRALQALEARGWVTRETDPDDRRIAHASLTRRGRRACDALLPELAAASERLLERLSEPERRTVTEALDILERSLAG